MSQKFINIPPLDLDSADPIGAITALTGDATATGPGSVPITLATVNATTGTFGSTASVGVFTVNEKGLITSASTAAIAFDGGITQLTGDLTAGPGSGSQVGTLATVNATTGTFGSTGKVGIYTVNSKGLIVSSSSVNIAFDGGITQLTGDGTAGPGSGSQALTFATVNATTGTFGSTGKVGVFTVNQKGLIVSSSSVNIAFDGGITQITGDLTAGPGSGSQAGTLATVNATTGTFGSIDKIGIFTVNAKGLVTAASTATLSTSGITQLTGDVLAGPGTGSQASTLATVNATTGTFGAIDRVGIFTVNNKGLVTAASTATISTSGITQLTGDGTAGPGSGSQALTLATVNATTGTFGSTGKVGVYTVNSKGLIISSSSVNIAFDGGITQLTGDATAGPGSGSQALTFATVNSTTGTFGSTGRVGVFTVNQKGLITSASTAAIAFDGGITQLTGGVTAGPGNGSQTATVQNVGIYATSSVVAATSAALGATPNSIPGTIVSRGLDGAGATYFAVDNIVSSGPLPSVDIKNAALADASGINSVVWDLRKLNYPSSSASLNWGLGIAYDSGFTRSMDYASRLLVDATNVQSVDWSNRYLRDSSLFIVTDWQNKALYVSSTGLSIDWSGRGLYDATTVQSVDWDNRLLATTGGATSIDWGNKLLKSNGNFTSADWEVRKLFNSRASTIIDWEAKLLRSSSTAIAAKWDPTGLGVTALSSTGAAASATTGAGSGISGSVVLGGFGSLAGTVTLATGAIAGPIATTAAVVSLSGNPTFVKGMKIFLQPVNDMATALYGPNQVYPVGSTGSSFSIITGSSALDVSTTYKWNYLVIG